MESLVPELQGFTPRPSTSNSAPFALDPALAGPGPASSAALAGRARYDAYWDDEDEYDDHEDSLDGSQYETDAEDEYQATQSRLPGAAGAKRTRRSSAGPLAQDGTPPAGARVDKGKGRAADQDLFALDDDEGGDEQLNRLIFAIRDSNSTGVGGATALDREFDRSIADELDAFDPDLMEDLSVGIKGRRRRRGRRTGGRRRAADVEPSPEVKRLLGQANQAYATGSLQEAIELLSEVVRIDPIIRVSWYTLATIYEELGEQEKAVQCKIVAAHLSGKDGASEWGDLGRECRDIGLLHQAIYCFTQAIKCNKEDVDAMWDRAILLKLSGANNMATKAFLALLSLLPHDPGVLRELAPLLAATEQHVKATALLLSAFNHYRAVVPLVTPESVHLLTTYGYADIELLADFLLAQRTFPEVVRVVRQGVRWLQGRELETGWDELEDDREYDEVRKSRDGWQRGNVWLEEEPTYELDVRLRSRLGLARLGLGMVNEAQHHFAIVTSEDVAEFPELFGAIGDAYFARKMYDEAFDVYRMLAENEETNGPTVWFKCGQCHQMLGDYEEAKECFENVIDEEPSNLEAKLALAKCLEQIGDPSRALVLIKQVIAAREAEHEEVQVDADGKRRRKPWKSREERAAARVNREAAERERHTEFQIAFSRLHELDAEIALGGEDGAEALGQWLELATSLVDSFRSTKQLFPSDYKKKFTGMLTSFRRKGKKAADIEEEADQMANRLQRTMIAEEDNEVEETSFRGLDFDGWADFILKYCFRLTEVDEIELAAEVLLHVRDAGVFRQSESREQTLRLGLIGCYLHANMLSQAQKELRFFLLRRQHETEPLRLLLALLAKYQAGTEAFNDPNLQKFFFRQTKTLHQAAKEHSGDGDARGGSPAALRKGKERAVEDEDDDDAGGAVEDEEGARPVGERFKPTKISPVYLASYGLMMLASQSYQPAIIYLLRAREVDKDQPLVNLALATAYFQRAMSRKTDNRQHQIVQGFAFLDHYRKVRGPCEESDYNLARAFHHFGFESQAVKHYERLLTSASASLAAAQQDGMQVDGAAPAEPSGLSKMAAYNLMLLYSMTGADELARATAEKWLSV
ncbi:hypothetical protein Rhopal_000790-T1 [Rhodotorula paludigena]|uniref:TPR-like protein n=1 Tax=Rhodotorula paludigena TaxID=86838 RepID=A0AAV5GDK7_9BASI|nr:hypothetical protein Rhopal_000790-T1 [Rhodotorula paludigena]